MVSSEEPRNGQPLIFISYARKDANWLERIQPYLKASLRQCSYTLWDDRGIQTGADWFDEIGKAIAAAQVAILLVSVDFLASDFIEKHEVKPLLERAERGELTVFLIPVRYADWEDRDFAKFQAACDPQRPLSGLNEHEQDVVLTDIGKKLKLHLQKSKRQLQKTNAVPEVSTQTHPENQVLPKTTPTGHSRASSIPAPSRYAYRLWQEQNQWIYFPPSSFIMGGPPDEKAPRRETMTHGFWLSRYPVTNAVFNDFIKAGCYDVDILWSSEGLRERKRKSWQQPAYWHHSGFNGPDQPVVGVSIYEAEAFCTWMSNFGVPSWIKAAAFLVCLPNERQWEYAARGCGGRVYPWGPQPPHEECANFNNTVGKTTPVDRYPLGATPEGMMDLAGNCWEWCVDAWDADSSRRVVRGGSWVFPAQFLATSIRDRYWCGYRDWFLGFRCCLVALPEQH